MASAKQLLKKGGGGGGLVTEVLTMNEVINNMISGAATPLKDWCSGTKLTKLRCFAIVLPLKSAARSKTIVCNSYAPLKYR